MSEVKVSKASVRTLIQRNYRNYSMIIMLALIMIVFSFLTNGINLNSRNFTNIIIQNSYILILAVGMIPVIIIGNIDLSVGRVCAFVGALSAMMYNAGIPMPLVVLGSICIGLGIGVFQGAWIAFLKLPAFIVTLGGMLLFRGLTYIITKVSPIGMRDDGYKQLASGLLSIKELEINGVHYTAILAGAIVFLVYLASELVTRRSRIRYNFEVSPMGVFIFKVVVIGLAIMGLCQRFATYAGLPVVVIVLGVTICVFTFIMNNTVLGRYVYAVGGNPRSAKMSGINSELVVFLVHVIMGGICGLAAVILTGYMNQALPQAGENLELDAIAACFIGGASTSGGIGTVIGAIVGGLVMAAINNGMSLMNMAPHWQYVVKASVLLLAVYYDIYTRRKAGLG